MMNKKIITILFIVAIVVVVALLGFGIIQEQTADHININFASEEEKKVYQEKLAKINEEIKNNPESNMGWVELAVLKEQSGDNQGAIEAYQKASEITPSDFLPLTNLGHLYERLGEYEKAEEPYLKAIAGAPHKVDLYRNIVDLYRYHLIAKHKQIPTVLLKGLEDPGNTNSAELLNQLALYYVDFGFIQEAIEIYERIAEAYPDNEAVKAELEELKASNQ